MAALQMKTNKRVDLPRMNNIEIVRLPGESSRSRLGDLVHHRHRQPCLPPVEIIGLQVEVRGNFVWLHLRIDIDAYDLRQPLAVRPLNITNARRSLVGAGCPSPQLCS